MRVHARVGVGALSLLTGSAAGAPTVKVWFLQGEQMLAVSRPGSTADDSLRQLLRGPTAEETKDGVETYVPAATKLRRFTVENGLATFDLRLRSLLSDGSVDGLARQWLTFDPATARVLG